MSARKAKRAAKRRSPANVAEPVLVDRAMRGLQKIGALLACMQYTANYLDRGEIEVDLADALSAVVAMVEQLLIDLDQTEARHATK